VRATWISLGILGATALVQLAILALTGSVALQADTIHNLTDALTAVPLLLAFRLGWRPPSPRYP
jgi:divalent metal cation (Fe/Co/Zn/Cd) transporter